MKPLPHFQPGQPVRAAEWNALAGEVNRIWAMRTGPDFELTKGEPWRLRFTGATDTITPSYGPMWEIYVYRASAPADWQVDLPPSAIFITGPFEVVGRTNANHIVKIQRKSKNKSRVDRDWCASFGLVTPPGNDYSFQRLSKCPATGDLLVTRGSFETDRVGTEGLFFAVDWETGARQFSPFANIEALAPGVTGEAVTGVASYNDTIACSVGFLGSSAPGIVLFDTAGNPVEVSPGNYIFQDNLSSTYHWLIASQGGYFYNSRFSEGTNPLFHKALASVAGGFDNDATFTANGFDPNLIGYTAAHRPRINSGEDGMHSQTGGWAGADATTQFTSFTVAGVTTILSEPGLPDIATYPTLIPFDYIDAVAGIVFGVSRQSVGDDWRFFLRTYNGSYVLTEISGFNGAVFDVKYFRTKDDGVTRQFIVVGEFTTYQGQPAPYMVFVDQNGNRLRDLEWP